MSRAADPTCRQTDLVLARFLDGDPHRHFAVEAELDAHLQACPDCRSALRRARRLDALLAQHSRVDVPAALADRLLSAALPVSAPRRNRTVPMALAAMALVGFGAALGFWFRQSNEVAPVPERAANADVDRPNPNPQIVGLMHLPMASASRLRRRFAIRPIRVDDDVALLRRRDLAGAVLPGVLIAQGLRQFTSPTGLWPTWGMLDQTAHRIAVQTRVRAGQNLLASGHARKRRQLVDFLASAPDDAVLRTLLAAAHENATFVRRLQARLTISQPDGNDVLVAARLGHRRVDIALRRLVRRSSKWTAQVATTVSQLEIRPGRIDLLLDLWSDKDLWSDQRPSTSDLRSWFCALPAAATAELVAAASSTNRAERRIRGITALGWRRDVAALDFLFRQIDGHQHESVRAAGHAISQMPIAGAEAAVLARLKHGRRPHVLLAALCGMRSDWPRSRLRTTDLTEEEAEFLWSGAFTLEQFDIACSLCRRRTLSNH